MLHILKEAFHIRKVPLPWMKAFNAGICAGLPVWLGAVLGNLPYGLIAGLGGFTYLYVFHIPYAQRAKKLFFVMLGLAFSVFLGTLLSPSPVASAIVLGLIGAIVTFLFGAYKVKGPAGIFFVLVFLMSGAIPTDPSQAWIHAGLALSGGAFSWVVAMLGWFADPHGLEKESVARAYQVLAHFLDAIGGDKQSEARREAVLSLRTAEESMASGHIRWQSSDTLRRLYLLHEQANFIFRHMLHPQGEQTAPLPKELSEALRRIAASIADDFNMPVATLTPPPDETDPALLTLYKLVNQAVNFVHERPNALIIDISKPSLRDITGAAFDKNSVVFLTAIRYGLILMFAALAAWLLALERPYWVPLSCAAVLSGATVVSTFHRAVLRTVGTVIGVLIAAAILSFHPEGVIIGLMIGWLTFLTELAIVLNYGIAALFITANSLLLAESTTQLNNVTYFAEVRIIDVLIGVAIGLLGTLLLGRGRAFHMLPHLLAKTIRSQQHYLFMLCSDPPKHDPLHQTAEHGKMQSNLTNLQLIYTTALGEIPSNKKKLQYLWPVLFSIEQLAYLLDACYKIEYRPKLPDEDVAQLLLLFETMAAAAEEQRAFVAKRVPKIPGYPEIQQEIEGLQDALLTSVPS